MIDISAAALLECFPPILAADEKIRALAEMTADILSGRLPEIDYATIYPRIDELPEPVIDALA